MKTSHYEEPPGEQEAVSCDSSRAGQGSRMRNKPAAREEGIATACAERWSSSEAMRPVWKPAGGFCFESKSPNWG